jgi:hypothetical protein
MAYDINAIIAEYGDDDFGFSSVFDTVSEKDYKKVIEDVATQSQREKNSTVEEYEENLANLEKLVLPFFSKLLKTADKEYIYWPKRKESVEQQIQKILTLTRG